MTVAPFRGFCGRFRLGVLEAGEHPPFSGLPGVVGNRVGLVALGRGEFDPNDDQTEFDLNGELGLLSVGNSSFPPFPHKSVVPGTGLEPARCYSLEPESSASANSATRASFALNDLQQH